MKAKIIIFLSISFCLFLFEILFRFTATELPNADYEAELYKDYSREQLDTNLITRSQFHGGKCIKIIYKKKFLWHPRIGHRDKSVNLNCVNELFKENKTNIIFMGGSAMANHEAPNYLTSIEYYMFKSDDMFRSINLAESGARLSNSLSIFIEYIPKLRIKPDAIIFFDGYNEFASIRYNGNSGDDFYWTAAVERRIHQPYKYYLDVILSRSHLLQFITKSLQIKNAKRLSPDKISKTKILDSANDYTYRKKILQNLCTIYKIKKCIFILQPIFILTKDLSSPTDVIIKEWHNKYFKNDDEIYKTGYKKIINSNNDIYDLTKIFDSQNNIYFDYVHTNKLGSEIIGNNLMNILKKELNLK